MYAGSGIPAQERLVATLALKRGTVSYLTLSQLHKKTLNINLPSFNRGHHYRAQLSRILERFARAF